MGIPEDILTEDEKSKLDFFARWAENAEGFWWLAPLEHHDETSEFREQVDILVLAGLLERRKTDDGANWLQEWRITDRGRLAHDNFLSFTDEHRSIHD